MKRFCQLILAIAWFTAPAIALLIMRECASTVGSYPFFGIISCLYGILYTSTDTAFVFIVLGASVFWIAMGAASLLVSRYHMLKFALCGFALLDLFVALLCPISALTAVWDAIIICAALVVGKQETPNRSKTPSAAVMRFTHILRGGRD